MPRASRRVQAAREAIKCRWGLVTKEVIEIEESDEETDESGSDDSCSESDNGDEATVSLDPMAVLSTSSFISAADAVTDSTAQIHEHDAGKRTVNDLKFDKNVPCNCVIHHNTS